MRGLPNLQSEQLAELPALVRPLVSLSLPVESPASMQCHRGAMNVGFEAVPAGKRLLVQKGRAMLGSSEVEEELTAAGEGGMRFNKGRGVCYCVKCAVLRYV